MILAYRGSILWSFIFRQHSLWKLRTTFYQGSTGDCTQNLEPSLARPILLSLFVWDRHHCANENIFKYVYTQKDPYPPDFGQWHRWEPQHSTVETECAKPFTAEMHLCNPLLKAKTLADRLLCLQGNQLLELHFSSHLSAVWHNSLIYFYCNAVLCLFSKQEAWLLSCCVHMLFGPCQESFGFSGSFRAWPAILALFLPFSLIFYTTQSLFELNLLCLTQIIK